MPLKPLLDRMIDQASERDPKGGYNILVGAGALAEQSGVVGMNVYRSCRVFQTLLVPNHTVVLAPSPDNLRHHDLVEYHGGLLNGGVTRVTIRKHTGFVVPAPIAPAPTTQTDG
jgi:hypothetical protein